MYNILAVTIFLASIIAPTPPDMYAGVLALHCDAGQGVYMQWQTTPRVEITAVFHRDSVDDSQRYQAGEDGRKNVWYAGEPDTVIDSVSWQAGAPIDLEVAQCFDDDDPPATGGE